MSDRDDFLANIRGALGRSAPLDAPVSEVPHSAGLPDELDRRVDVVQELMSRDADNLMSNTRAGGSDIGLERGAS